MPNNHRPMSGPVKVCAVTLNWKRCDDTLECLGSLYRSGVEGLEVIVIDNGSHDGSAERIRQAFPQAFLVVNDRNEGYAKAANQGIRLALEHGATHILTINNDAVGHGAFLRTMMEAFPRHPDAGILGCKILYYGTDTIWYGGGHFNDL
ncbi:MAG TPA: glycosyltransferase, partial [Methanomassiliicoccales archaeon]|nr:glycosyltransferase [Methanomassiliicoccales archaeon]